VVEQTPTNLSNKMEEVAISDTKQECDEVREESEIKNVVKGDMFPDVSDYLG